jgi:hypothetical protein
MLNKLIGGFVVIMVGVSLLPEFAKPNSLIGWTIDKEDKPKRQTYEEYVRERLEVERLMHKY